MYSLERAASLCSGAELVQNPEDLQVLHRLGVPSDKLVLLGNGVDLERFRPGSGAGVAEQARADLGVDAGGGRGRDGRPPGLAEGLP